MIRARRYLGVATAAWPPWSWLLVILLGLVLQPALAASPGWPEPPLPPGIDSFVLGDELQSNGTPVRIRGFVSRQSPSALTQWFRQHWGSPLAETPLGRQHVLGRLQDGFYLSVQIESPGLDGQGSRGLVAVSDLRAMWQGRAHDRASLQHWLRRWPSGTEVLSRLGSQDAGRQSSHQVLRNGHSVALNRQALINLMQQDGYRLDPGLRPSPQPLQGTLLRFQGDHKEAIAILAPAADGGCTITLNTVAVLSNASVP